MLEVFLLLWFYKACEQKLRNPSLIAYIVNNFNGAQLKWKFK